VTEYARADLIAKPLARHALVQRGFTLIEIMVVVVIIGLLAAIVAPSLIGQVDTAAVNRARQDIRAIETALNLYRLDNYRYPTTDEGLQALVSGGGPDGGRQYLRRIPVDPWNNPYQYAYPGRRGEFDVFSFGADGREGGEGLNAEIGNWDLD
jgi:general secretion pathway protein G